MSGGARPEIDPEVAADLALRASSQFDTDRTRGAVGVSGARWSPPKFVTQWPCRGKCGVLVDVDEFTVEVFAKFNRVLRQRDEQPLDASAIVFCDACRDQGKALAAQRNRQKVDAIGNAIRELKELAAQPETPRSLEQQRDILMKLRKHGHPDVDGLVLAIRESLSAKKKGRTV